MTSHNIPGRPRKGGSEGERGRRRDIMNDCLLVYGQIHLLNDISVHSIVNALITARLESEKQKQ